MRESPLPILLCGLALVAAARGDDRPKDPRPAISARNARLAKTTKQGREDSALAFVREHHPELASLLEQLKVMNPREYERAILEIDQVSRSLENIQSRSPKRYELGVEAWKAKSKVELLAARWVSAPSAELESQLRAALEEQAEVELRVQQLERAQLRERLKKTEEQIDRLKNHRDKWVESRFQGLRNKNQRKRQLDAGKSAPAKPARTKGDSKA